VTGGSTAALKITAHDLPPVVALRRLYVHEVNAHPTFGTMADDRAHLQFSSGVIVVNTEMNFNFRSHGVLNLTQDAHAQRAHVCQETGDELVGWAKQNAPISGAPRTASPFGRWIVGQSSNRISPGLRGKLLTRGCLERLSMNC
jgi:hypothetical protein